MGIQAKLINKSWFESLFSKEISVHNNYTLAGVRLRKSFPTWQHYVWYLMLTQEHVMLQNNSYSFLNIEYEYWTKPNNHDLPP